MAQIKYLDSRRIMGASGDTVEATTFEDDFSSDNWTDYGSDFGVSGGTMAWNKTVNSGSWINLGSSLSDEKWVCRFTLNILNASSFNNEQPIFMIGSVSGSVTDATTMDYIGFQLQTYSNDYYIWCGNGATLASPTYNTNLSKTITTGTVYVELRRTSATEVILSIYSDSGFSSLSATKTLTISSGITGLQYFRLHSRLAGTGTINGTIDNLEIYNGLSSVTGKPAPALSLSGCKAYYNFEQTSGSLTNIATTANGFDDGLGSSADGTNNGATTGATGKVGSYAWDFTGASDYVTIGDTSTWKFLHDETTSNTISFWVKRSGTQASGEPCILDTQGATASNVGLSLFFDTSNNLYYYVSDGTGLDIKSSSAITTSTTDFDHLVFVQDWTNLTIYKNGSLIQTIDMTSFSGSTGNSASALNIGRNIRTSTNANFYLDELAIFSRALTSSEISALYNSGTGVAVNDSSITAKPETNSIFIETDTASRWWYDGTYWNMQPTFQDDFSTNNFNDTGTKIGVANNTLEWDGTQNGSVNGSTIDLTSIDTKAIFRAKLRINTLTAPSSASNFVLIGFSDSDHTTAGDSNQDGIGLIIQNDADVASSFRAMHVDGAPFSPNAGTVFATVPATATDYFIEVVLDNSTWYVRIYSDSNYSVLIEQETGSMTATGLRYFGIKMRSSASVNGTFDGYIDDFKFYNGVTSVQQ